MPIAEQEDFHRLWDELADFEANKWTEAAAHLMSSLAGRVGAWNATWAGAVRVEAESVDDPLLGWRVAAMQALRAVEPHPEEGHFKEIMKIWDRREIDPSFLLPLEGVGSFRAYSLRRGLPASWFRGPFFEQHYGAVGTQDAVFIAFPLNDYCESHFGFYTATAFSDEHIAALAYTLRGIKWFHRQLLMANGLLMASAPLTPTERRVLQFLLTSASEKDIAHQMALAASTTHQHVTRIFRKFGVRSRAELMSLWLRRIG